MKLYTERQQERRVEGSTTRYRDLYSLGVRKRRGECLRLRMGCQTVLVVKLEISNPLRPQRTQGPESRSGQGKDSEEG